MKPLKKAYQNNVEVNRDFYSRDELKDMIENRRAFYINRAFCPSNDLAYFDSYEDKVRLYLDDVSEIKVICHNGYYTNVAIIKTGEQVFITL